MLPPRNLNEMIAMEEAGIPREEIWRAALGDDRIEAAAQLLSSDDFRFSLERLLLKAMAYTAHKYRMDFRHRRFDVGGEHPAMPLALAIVDRIRRDAKKPVKLSPQEMPKGARQRRDLHEYRWNEALLDALLFTVYWQKCKKPIGGLVSAALGRMKQQIRNDEKDYTKLFKRGIALTPVQDIRHISSETVKVPQWSEKFAQEMREAVRTDTLMEQYGQLRLAGQKPEAIWKKLSLDNRAGQALDRRYRRIREKIRKRGEWFSFEALFAGQSDASRFVFREHLDDGLFVWQHRPFDDAAVVEFLTEFFRGLTAREPNPLITKNK
jgi:hypothetical protein